MRRNVAPLHVEWGRCCLHEKWTFHNKQNRIRFLLYIQLRTSIRQLWASILDMKKNKFQSFCPPYRMINPRSAKSKFVDTTGSMIGLIVLIDAQIDDYFYTFNQLQGLKLLIFEPHEYPDVGTGSTAESIIGLGLETFVSIDPITVTTEEDTKRYSSKVVTLRRFKLNLHLNVLPCYSL